MKTIKKHTIQTIFIVLGFFISSEATADTIRMMQYNLMYYTSSAPEDCNSITNNLDVKDSSLKKTIQYIKPDVFCVNEIGKEALYANRILNNVMNQDGIDYYAMIPTTSNPYYGITIGNMIFYNTEKLTFYNSFYVTTSIMYFNAYKFYYNSPTLANGDSIFVTFIVTHLKAGNAQTMRYNQVKKLMDRLENMGKIENYVLSGDFNCYSSEDSGIAYALNYPNENYRFYDPIDELGYWQYNEDFAQYHTISTHFTSDGCFSYGGLSGRFDFILVNEDVYSGRQGISPIISSYKVLGQDGNRFQHSLIDPENNSLSADIIEALYATSDHLPVMMDFLVTPADTAPQVGIAQPLNDYAITITNPSGDLLRIHINSTKEHVLNMYLYTLEGKLLESFNERIAAGRQQIIQEFPYSHGYYFLHIQDDSGNQSIKKIIKL